MATLWRMRKKNRPAHCAAAKTATSQRRAGLQRAQWGSLWALAAGGGPNGVAVTVKCSELRIEFGVGVGKRVKVAVGARVGIGVRVALEITPIGIPNMRSCGVHPQMRTGASFKFGIAARHDNGCRQERMKTTTDVDNNGCRQQRMKTAAAVGGYYPFYPYRLL
jgi:hypothetical protein